MPAKIGIYRNNHPFDVMAESKKLRTLTGLAYEAIKFNLEHNNPDVAKWVYEMVLGKPRVSADIQLDSTSTGIALNVFTLDQLKSLAKDIEHKQLKQLDTIIIGSVVETVDDNVRESS